MDEVNSELTVLLASMYHLVETGRSDDAFGAECMQLAWRDGAEDDVEKGAGLIGYLCGLVSSLREKNAKGYPVKKVSCSSEYLAVQATLTMDHSTAIAAIVEDHARHIRWNEGH